jgi:hypothetical protein
MGYTFARVGAATEMKVEDFYVQRERPVWAACTSCVWAMMMC